MPKEYSLLHEATFTEGVQSLTYSVPFAGGTKEYKYATNMNTCWQLNITRGTSRRIRRVAAMVTHGEAWVHISKH